MSNITTAHFSQPYNPWSSFLVEASAGSGKTWQLSRRFLALVSAGADPSSILTVTFTKKAAAEMRDRIVRDAIGLGQGAEQFRGFSDQIASWRPESPKYSLRTPQETSEAILDKTQSLKIMTIDSLFLQWCRKNPIETSIDLNGEVLESPWTLMSNLEAKRLYNDAWTKVLASAKSDQANKELMQSLIANAPNGKLRSLLTAISPLIESETFAWYLKLSSANDVLRTFTVEEPLDDPQTFISKHRELFLSVIDLASNQEKREQGLHAIKNKDFNGLLQASIVTSSFESLNANTFSKAKKNGEPAFIALNQLLQSWTGQHKIANLNRTARLLWTLFEARSNEAHRTKCNKKIGGFSDAVKGVSLLACDEDLSAARAASWSSIRHLMLDEFQDTSRLQWMIFEKLSMELLSGYSSDHQIGPPPSVFIVGDKKQSIYRFREADPEVLDIAKSKLKPLGMSEFLLNKSFRSSKLILDFVNQVFKDRKNIKDFPLHEPASNHGIGSICVYEISPTKEKNGSTEIDFAKSAKSQVESEAKVIAAHIKSALSGTIDIKISVNNGTNWRRPKPSDFAILYAKSTHSDIYEKALRDNKIPCARAERKGFYNRPEIVDLMALVQWLTWPGDSVALCTILKSPIFGLSDQSLQNLIKNGENAIVSNLKNFSVDIFDALQDLLMTAQNGSAAVLAGKLLTKYKVADLYLTSFGPVEGPLAKANILKWFDSLRSVSASENGIVGKLAQWLEDASEENETGNASSVGDSVTLMTIHKSKGLEFPCVVLAGTTGDWHRDDHGWIKDTRPGSEGFWYIGTNSQRPKDSPEIESLISYNQAQSREEKARLLYVALTRASQHIAITGSPTDDLNAFWPLLQAASVKIDGANFQEIPILDYVKGTLITQNVSNSDFIEMKDVSTEPSDERYLRHDSGGYPALKILTPSKRSKILPEDTDDRLTKARERDEIPPELRIAYGILVHKVIELKLSNQTWTPSQLSVLVKNASTKTLTEGELNKLIDLANLDVTNLLSSSQWKLLMDDALEVLCEVPMASVEGDTLINAVADLVILRKNGDYRVIDFKTSPVDPINALNFCHSRGYLDQVKDYCKILERAKKGSKALGYVVFVSPISLVETN